MKLERMDAFFDSRLDGYDEHMLTNIAGAGEFYPFTASRMPEMPGARVLDLGCGTGLELGEYFKLNPTARITGIDLAEGMLSALGEKFPDRELTLIQGDYFTVPFGEACFHGSVSVESLHHFTKDEKIPLYTKLYRALKSGGTFVLTDYFSLSDEEEQFHRAELLRLKELQGISDREFYHYDTPLTVAHELEALREAGFAQIAVLANWGATYCIQATK